MKYTGNLTITKENQNDFKDLTEVDGFLSIHSDVNLPKLETVGQHLIIHSGVKANLLKLETVGGFLSIHPDVDVNLPKLETVGVDLIIRSNVNLPKLETVGGDLNINSDVNVNLGKLEDYDSEYSKNIAETNLQLTLLQKGFVLVDGILSKLISEKYIDDILVMKVIKVGQTKVSYLVHQDNNFSHGETIKQAIDDLKYKVSARDLSEFTCWKKDPYKKVTLEEAIVGYKTITGACSLGIKDFVQNIEIPKEITPKGIVKLTEGRYGNQIFKKFLEE